MGSLVSDVTRALLGIGTELSLLAWALVTVLLVAIGPLLVQVGVRVFGPPARLVAAEPARAAGWSVGFVALLAASMLVAMALSILAAPAALLLAAWALAAGFIGYFAVAWLVGERLAAALGASSAPAPWLATLAGLVVIRLARLVPFVGGLVHALVVLAGCGACAAVSWRLAIAWHRRRMPDAEQFAGELLVEWYPDGDPEDGRPAVQTGRPVVGNIRGEEDRVREDEDDEPQPPAT